MRRPAAAILALIGAATVAAQQPPASADAGAAFARFLQARTSTEARAAIQLLVDARVGVDEALARLRTGRRYASEVPHGVVQGSYTNGTDEFFYTLDVPTTYDPSRRYQVRVQLHGGVGRIERSAAPRADQNARLAGAEQIYVMPYAWRDAPWWSRRQTENLRTILDLVKRTYNVDENRVVLAGVSDGGTGTYFTAMRDTTPYASFLPLNGFIMVLANEMAAGEGDLFPNNLLNKPLLVVNGGRDPLYPTSLVDPYIDHLVKGGVDLTYRPQPNAAHETSWWPDLKDEVERFVTDHLRRPLPDRLTWESGDVPGRAHWLVIDRLKPGAAEDPELPDLNRRASRPELAFGIRSVGPRINRVVKGSNAQQMGVESGDVVTAVNGQPLTAGSDIADIIQGFPSGRPLVLTVSRGERSVRLAGRYSPTMLAGNAEYLFPPEQPSGRVDLVRSGNRVEARTRGVATFRLLLSPDQFDLSKPVTVVVNGSTVIDRIVDKDLRTLLEWAARDNDRTMLFEAEVTVDVP